jgi:hypothetical protein
MEAASMVFGVEPSISTAVAHPAMADGSYNPFPVRKALVSAWALAAARRCQVGQHAGHVGDQVVRNRDLPEKLFHRDVEMLKWGGVDRQESRRAAPAAPNMPDAATVRDG